ncbi:hypothetical protein [Nostoc sp. C117]
MKHLNVKAEALTDCAKHSNVKMEAATQKAEVPTGKLSFVLIAIAYVL